MSEKGTVSGFSFADEESLEQAKKEAEGIKYLRTKLDMGNPSQVLVIYNHAVDQEVFKTPVGFSFLKELQDFLKGYPMIKPEDIHRIRVPEGKVVIKREPAKKEQRKERGVKRGAFGVSLFFNFVLLAVCIGMFVIAFLSRDNVTILNYENRLIDKYEDWEKELTQRERIVREKERGLGIEGSYESDEDPGG